VIFNCECRTSLSKGTSETTPAVRKILAYVQNSKRLGVAGHRANPE